MRAPVLDTERARLEGLVDGLIDEEHAFLHLNRSQEYLSAFLCACGPAGPVTVSLEVSSTPIHTIERAFAEWEEGEPASLARVNVTGPAWDLPDHDRR